MAATASRISAAARTATIKPAFRELVAANTYINARDTEKHGDAHSFHTLASCGSKMSQGQKIMLGHCVEKVMRDAVLSCKKQSCVDARDKPRAGEHETDMLFVFDDSKLVMYAECKANINLDTEKSKSTDQKCQTVLEGLRAKYPGYDVKACVLALRYLSMEEPLAKTHAKKYKLTPVLGVNDFLAQFGLEGFTTYEEYTALIDDIVERKWGLTK